MKHDNTYHGVVYGVASSREDAWIETIADTSVVCCITVASSREDAWIETVFLMSFLVTLTVASSREDAWIETLSAAHS